MEKIYDLNPYKLGEKNGFYGGIAGEKDGIVINGENWLVKYPKSLSQMVGENASYSTAPLSEYIGSHIYEILGYDVHKTILGERNNKLVVACKDFETDGKRLMEIRTIKNHTNPELSKLLENRSVSSSESHVVDLEELLLHLDKNDILKNIKDIKQHFFEQAIVDIFINNNDRNNGNWGIIRERGKNDRIAPIFDNGGSFSTKLPEDKLARILNSPELSNNSQNILTAYGKGEHQYNAKKFIKQVRNIPEFKTALQKVVTLINDNIENIKSMMDQIPDSHILQNGDKVSVLSENRRELYKKQLDIRLEAILIPEYEKIAGIHVLEEENQDKRNSYTANRGNVSVECVTKADGSGTLTLDNGRNEIIVPFKSITELEGVEVDFIGWTEADVEKASESIGEILEQIPGCDIEIAGDEEQEIPEHEELSNNEIEQDDAGIEDIETDDHDEIGL